MSAASRIIIISVRLKWFGCIERMQVIACPFPHGLPSQIIGLDRPYHTHRRHRRFWHVTHDCVAPYVDIILHRGQFWAKSASGSVRCCCFRSCWMVLSHVMQGRPSCLLQSAGGEANRILLAFALSSMHIICQNRVSRRDWIIAVSLGCFVSLRTSSFRTNWYHLMPSSIRRHHWSSASTCRFIFSSFFSLNILCLLHVVN